MQAKRGWSAKHGKPLLMLCSFHAASGVVRATQERERRDRAQAVPLKLPFTTLYQDDVGTAKIHRTNYALHLLHEGGGVRLEGIRGSVYLYDV